MRKGTHLYPFQGKKMSLSEISRYYNQKGIELNYNMFMTAVRKLADKVGKENITEEQILNTVKDVLSKKTLGAALPDFKENCIKEFGANFWDDLLKRKMDAVQKRKEKIKKSKDFREQMKVDLDKIGKNEKTVKECEKKIEKRGKDGESR